ncbi:hypothetical protein EfmAA290_32170 (plasmid) [Enterococcus faecium]|nr:hypothetical protein EfmAA290_32170 [Enterococcus faecium]
MHRVTKTYFKKKKARLQYLAFFIMYKYKHKHIRIHVYKHVYVYISKHVYENYLRYTLKFILRRL